MWWTDWHAELANTLGDRRFKEFFEDHPDAELTILAGSRITHVTSSFTEGQFWGQMREMRNLPLPAGSLAWLLTEGKMAIDLTGSYNAELDLEEYRLLLTKNGLQQRITHRHRKGFRGATSGPDKGYERALRDEIQYQGFIDNGNGLLVRRAEFIFIHPLKDSIDETLYRSNVPLKTIVRYLKKEARRCFDPHYVRLRTAMRFRPINVTGVEKMDGTFREATLTGTQQHPVKNGVVEMNWTRPHGHGSWK